MLSLQALRSSAKLLKRQSAVIGATANGALRAQQVSSMHTLPKVDEPTWFQINGPLTNWHKPRPSSKIDRVLDIEESWHKQIDQLVTSVGRSTAALSCQNDGEQVTGTVLTADGYVLTSARALTPSQRTIPLNETKVKASLYNSDYGGEEGSVVFVDYHYDVAIVKLKTEYTGFLHVPKFSNFNESIPLSPYTYIGRNRFYTYIGRNRLNDNVWHPAPFVYKKCSLIRNEYTVLDQGDIEQELLKFEDLTTEELLEYKDVIPSYHSENPAPCKSNFGGPVVDDKGGVIGVLTTTRSGHEYAVSSNLILKILRHFEKYGKVIRPYLGVTFSASDSANWIEMVVNNGPKKNEKTYVPDGSKAMYIEKVVPNSPADKGGLREGDVVIQINGQWIRNPYELTDLLWDKTGLPVEFTVVPPDYPYTMQTRVVWPSEVVPDAIERFEDELEIDHGNDGSRSTDPDDDPRSDIADRDAVSDGDEEIDDSSASSSTSDDDDDSDDDSSTSSTSDDDDDDHDDVTRQDNDVHSSTSPTDVQVRDDDTTTCHDDVHPSTSSDAVEMRDDDNVTHDDSHSSSDDDDDAWRDVIAAADDDSVNMKDDNGDMDRAKVILSTLYSIEKQLKHIANDVEFELAKKANKSTVDKLKWEVSRLKRGIYGDKKLK